MTSVFNDFLTTSDKYIARDRVRVVWDVGAGDCAESVSAREAYPNAHIYAFEANPACIHDCCKNIVNLDRMSFVPICVNNNNCFVDFHPINQTKTITTHADGNPKASSLFVANGSYPIETYIQDTIRIPSMRLNTMQILFCIPDPDIVWMDLQGAELLALKSMRLEELNTLIIHVEGWNKETYTGQGLFPEMDSHLEYYGFECINKPVNDEWIWADFDYINRRYKGVVT